MLKSPPLNVEKHPGYDYNDNDDDNSRGASSGGDEDNTRSRGGSKGIQIMITQRMRRVLEDELGYGTDEVDIMEPQIAAVVIERGLARPSAGMPRSWRKKRTWPINDKAFSGFGDRIKTLCGQLKAPAVFAVQRVLPVALAGGATILALPHVINLLGLGQSLIIGGIKGLASIRLPSIKLPALPAAAPARKATVSKPPPAPVQTKAAPAPAPPKQQKRPAAKAAATEAPRYDLNTGRVDMKALGSVLKKGW